LHTKDSKSDEPGDDDGGTRVWVSAFKIKQIDILFANKPLDRSRRYAPKKDTWFRDDIFAWPTSKDDFYDFSGKDFTEEQQLLAQPTDKARWDVSYNVAVVCRKKDGSLSKRPLAEVKYRLII